MQQVEAVKPGREHGRGQGQADAGKAGNPSLEAAVGPSATTLPQLMILQSQKIVLQITRKMALPQMILSNVIGFVDGVVRVGGCGWWL